MQVQIEILFRGMMSDIALFKKKHLAELQEVESCYQIASKYWNKVRQLVFTHEFAQLRDEVEFFRRTKPRFTSEIEYYSLLYHAIIFEPERNFAAKKKFWEREFGRLAKFIDDHREFYNYYKSGRSDRDGEYFTRCKGPLDIFFQRKGISTENKSKSSHDYLVSTLLAVERYMEYVRERMETLKESAD